MSAEQQRSLEESDPQTADSEVAMVEAQAAAETEAEEMETEATEEAETVAAEEEMVVEETATAASADPPRMPAATSQPQCGNARPESGSPTSSDIACTHPRQEASPSHSRQIQIHPASSARA